MSVVEIAAMLGACGSLSFLAFVCRPLEPTPAVDPTAADLDRSDLAAG